MYSKGCQVHVCVEYFSWLVALEAIGYSRKNVPHPPSLMDGKLRGGGGGGQGLWKGDLDLKNLHWGSLKPVNSK